jgi:hypothetical protein
MAYFSSTIAKLDSTPSISAIPTNIKNTIA